MRKKRGFTVIEVMMTIMMLSIITIAATSLIYTMLSGSGKASNTSIVKQNGDHAIGLIERQVRNAQAADCVGGRLDITDVDGTLSSFQVVSNRIVLAGTILTSDVVEATNFTCDRTLGGPGEPDIVEVSFQLAIPSPGGASEIAEETFKTRVSLRTY